MTKPTSRPGFLSPPPNQLDPRELPKYSPYLASKTIHPLPSDPRQSILDAIKFNLTGCSFSSAPPDVPGASAPDFEALGGTPSSESIRLHNLFEQPAPAHDYREWEAQFPQFSIQSLPPLPSSPVESEDSDPFADMPSLEAVAPFHNSARSTTTTQGSLEAADPLDQPNHLMSLPGLPDSPISVSRPPHNFSFVEGLQASSDPFDSTWSLDDAPASSSASFSVMPQEAQTNKKQSPPSSRKRGFSKEELGLSFKRKPQAKKGAGKGGSSLIEQMRGLSVSGSNQQKKAKSESGSSRPPEAQTLEVEGFNYNRSPVDQNYFNMIKLNRDVQYNDLSE